MDLLTAGTFVEKILGAPEGTIVFRKPDIVLTHDSTIGVKMTFEKMGGKKLFDPGQLLVVLDHNTPPTPQSSQTITEISVTLSRHRASALAGIIEKKGLVNWLKDLQ